MSLAGTGAGRGGTSTVLFSVVVPVYGHWHLVPALLERMRGQTLGQERFELVLVDNGTPDLDLPRNLPANLSVLRCDRPGSYAARNRGALHARGEWLAFTDADCLPAPDWLARLHEAALHRGGNALIAGPVEVVGSSQKPGIWEIFDIVKGIPQERYYRHGYAATANLAVPKAVFDALGGFDGRRLSGGDADFCRRARAAGFPLVYAAEARIDHPARTTWREIATKARRVKGGQLAAGSAGRRGVWLLRTVTPPVLGLWNFLRSTRHPLGYRLIACLVLFRVWLVELIEAVRLLAGGQPERR